MIKQIAAVVLLSGCASVAVAQMRPIPQDAVRGEMRHVEDMIVEIDGTPQRLAPGAQIRDTANRVLLPVGVPPGILVKYVLDGAGLIQRVWILTPEEAAQPDPRR
jgi:hypothetical protein